MQKPVINYKGYMTDNPSDRTLPKICVPQIVDRNQVQTLEQVVAHAIDRGLIAGLKTSAAKSIADGIMLQLGETLNGGTGVIFGDFFAVRPYLTGTIANLLAPITTENKLRVRFVPGSAYKLDEKDFSFHNVTESENLPKIVEIVPDENGATPGTYKNDVALIISGEHLKLDADDVIKVFDASVNPPTYSKSFAASNVETNNDACLGVMGDQVVELPNKAGFKVVKTITVDGVEQTIESNMVVADKAV